MAWEDDQAAIFGADTQEELNARMQADAKRMAGGKKRPKVQRAGRQPKAEIGMYGDQGWDQAMGASMYGAAIGGAQAQHLQGMANQATAAISKENDSRVAQQREARRMQHEINLKRMELDALLARIASARKEADTGPRPSVSFPGGSIFHGV